MVRRAYGVARDGGYERLSQKPYRISAHAAGKLLRRCADLSVGLRLLDHAIEPVNGALLAGDVRIRIVVWRLLRCTRDHRRGDGVPAPLRQSLEDVVPARLQHAER